MATSTYEEATRAFGLDANKAGEVERTSDKYDLTAAEAAVVLKRAGTKGEVADHAEQIKRERVAGYAPEATAEVPTATAAATVEPAAEEKTETRTRAKAEET